MRNYYNYLNFTQLESTIIKIGEVTEQSKGLTSERVLGCVWKKTKFSFSPQVFWAFKHEKYNTLEMLVLKSIHQLN